MEGLYDFSTGAFEGGALDSIFGTAAEVGSGGTYDVGRTAATETSNAIQATLPVDPNASDKWSGFWRDTIKSVVGYGLAKDMQQTKVQTQVQSGNAVAVRSRSDDRRLLMFAGIGFAAYMLLRKG